MNSLESNLSLELFGRNALLLGTVGLLWAQPCSVGCAVLSRCTWKGTEKRTRNGGSPSLAELRSPLTFVTSFDIYTSVVGLPLPSPVHTPGSGTRANHNTVPWDGIKTHIDILLAPLPQHAASPGISIHNFSWVHLFFFFSINASSWMMELHCDKRRAS